MSPPAAPPHIGSSVDAPASASRRALSRAGAALRLLALAALALHLTAGAWSAASHSLAWIAAGVAHRGESFQEGRRRALGGYALGLELVEAGLPPSAEYLLITTVEGGGHVVLQGDLAPRRAYHDGESAHGLPGHWRRRGIPPHAPWAVVYFHGRDRPPTIEGILEHPQAWPRPVEE